MAQGALASFICHYVFGIVHIRVNIGMCGGSHKREMIGLRGSGSRVWGSRSRAQGLVYGLRPSRVS